jgi:hypothetical protein
VFLPGPVRVAEHKVHVGDAIGPGGGVYTYTGTTRLVTVALAVDKQQLVRRNETVTVELPDGRTVSGRIAAIGTVAHQSDTGSGNDGNASGNDNGSGESTIDVTVAIADRAAARPRRGRAAGRRGGGRPRRLTACRR